MTLLWVVYNAQNLLNSILFKLLVLEKEIIIFFTGLIFYIAYFVDYYFFVSVYSMQAITKS